MPFPYTPDLRTQNEAIVALTEAEAYIGQSMADYFCNDLIPLIVAEEVENQVSLLKSTMCSMSVKEDAMAEVLDALAHKILADKGIVPCDDDGDFCSC